MAIFIPEREIKKEFHGSLGEYELYNLFKNLSDEYYIFHSIEWFNENGNKTWGESDYVVFHPKRGLLVVEVKGGKITSKKNKFYQENTITKFKKGIMDPMKQASRSKYRFIKELEKNNIKSYKIDVAVWFTGVERFEDLKNLPLTYSKGNILTKEDYNNIEESLDRVFDFYEMPLLNNFDDLDSLRVLHILSPEFNAITTLNNRLEEEKFIFKQMTEEQIKILDFLEDERIASIKGGAGTGKTTVGIEKARRLGIKGEKVLFLTYNKFLADTLKEMYKNILSNVDFYSLYSLAFELKGSLRDKDEEVLDILKKYKENWKYKNIVIDEGQDFESDILKELYNIVKEKDGEFYLFYDHNQLVNLKYRDKNWTNPIDGITLKLKINCRNTKNIAEMSYAYIENKEKNEILIKSNTIEGEKIEYLVHNDEKEYYRNIVKILKKYEAQGISKNRIVMISLKSEENSSLSKIRKIGEFNLVKTISKDENKILKTTVRKYKGLEADIVILVDLDRESIAYEDIEKLFYVSCSRAKHILHILSEIELKELKFYKNNEEIIEKIVM